MIEGYDFYYVAELDKYERDNMYKTEVTDFDYMHEFGFENIVVPKQTYVVFTTEEQAYPVNDYMDIRKRIVRVSTLLLAISYFYPPAKQGVNFVTDNIRVVLCQ